MDDRYYLGLDLGTSSLKVLAVGTGGGRHTVKIPYAAPGTDGWSAALRQGFSAVTGEIDPARIAGIGLSSQVGTYIAESDGRPPVIIGWNSDAGREELTEIKSAVSEAQFLREIDMAHPDLISYPLPRLLYIRRHHPDTRRVLMPKEWILRTLTGNAVTDAFSQRGIAHTGQGTYAVSLMEKFGLTSPLPPILRPTDRAGSVTAEAAAAFGLREGTPVFVGCNDFFAGLLGMGVWETGDVFDLSGTSEHVGIITDALMPGELVSGRYLAHYVTYGGTKASGVSSSFAIQNFGLAGVTADRIYRRPPLFLPYLTGERAPIFDENARGVFFGIGGETDRGDLAYAVLEGIVFSLWDIAERLGIPRGGSLITGGGSAKDPVMAYLKAELFGREIRTVSENETSALGAAMLAMVGDGVFADPAEAIRTLVRYDTAAVPDGRIADRLADRFRLYRSLYPSLKENFADFSRLGGM